ncbi:hypothetical protein E8E13_010339 [Curvularia kusanoi]|uniref:Uncharacterized protein n=1 Tax=Curvularia kusanoi TaxID=90978 RepID=A0A9P4TJV1_CURKU|nr:hypothetical protein E8E13_010339 [Curvularia kusanoi]
MRVQLLATLLLVRHALAGPARRDCGQTKCYNPVNECGITYGGCWTECESGMTAAPTFTAPLCISGTTTQAFETATVTFATDSSTGSLITPSPSLDASATATPTKSKSCSHLWLCIDYLAVCGDEQQMYGGCYDTCTSAPPFESPPCSLSSTTLTSSALASNTLSSSPSESGYAVPTPTPSSHPGTAFTEKPASDGIDPAIDSNKALVMAEMPMPSSSDTPTSIPSPPSELRVANVQSTSKPLEAPAGGNLRAAAIAKMEANPFRTATVSNVPCYTPGCKEYGESSTPAPVAPSSVDSMAESSVVATPVPSAEASTTAPAETPVESSVLAETPAETSSV